jgi:hypothetical protein
MLDYSVVNLIDMQDLVQNNLIIDPVRNFMRQAVLKKYGDKSDSNFIDLETTRIYNDFGDSILAHFRPMITSEKKLELDRVIKESNNQEIILAFLMQSIENFEQKIIQYLIEYKDLYIGEKGV